MSEVDPGCDYEIPPPRNDQGMAVLARVVNAALTDFADEDPITFYVMFAVFLQQITSIRRDMEKTIQILEIVTDNCRDVWARRQATDPSPAGSGAAAGPDADREA